MRELAPVVCKWLSQPLSANAIDLDRAQFMITVDRGGYSADRRRECDRYSSYAAFLCIYASFSAHRTVSFLVTSDHNESRTESTEKPVVCVISNHFGVRASYYWLNRFLSHWHLLVAMLAVAFLMGLKLPFMCCVFSDRFHGCDRSETWPTATRSAGLLSECCCALRSVWGLITLRHIRGFIFWFARCSLLLSNFRCRGRP